MTSCVEVPERPTRPTFGPFQKNLLQELADARHRRGWSVDQIAQRCGIDPVRLAAWEQGGGSPDLESAIKWADALGLKIALKTIQTVNQPRVIVDWDSRRLLVDGAPVRLTPLEWKALECLAARPGEVVTQEALFRHLYGPDRPYRTQSTALRVLITKLRRLLPVRIEARWGRGYVITGIAPSTEATAARQVSLPVQQQDPALRPVAPPGPVRRTARETNATTPARPSQPAANVSTLRAQELSVIRDFLANRGATSCPDADSLQRTPLPGLVWNKTTRKWTRPVAPQTADSDRQNPRG